MNIIMNKKTYDFIVKNGGKLIIRYTSIACGWSGNIKSLWVEAVKDFSDIKNYNLINYNGIEIYINKNLSVSQNIEINFKYNLPLLGQGFQVKGISF